MNMIIQPKIVGDTLRVERDKRNLNVELSYCSNLMTTEQCSK